jgi:DNA-binding beta-propeller fold protein YncE
MRLISALLLTGVCGNHVAQATEPLVLEQKIPLGDVSGRIDHLAVDLPRQRLFVAELGNNSVGVVDLRARKVLHRIGGLLEPQGVGYVLETDTLFVANAGDGSVRRFRGADFAPIDRLDLGDDADNIRVDARAYQIVIGYGSGALALIDATTAQKMAEIRLPAHPESFQLEQSGTHIFVNVPDARQISVVDRTSGQQTAKWTLPAASANFPMALDEARARLLVVYRKPAVLAVFDTHDGKVVQRLPTCGDADDIFLDARRQRVYVSCGEGVIDVLQRQGDTLASLARLNTVSGARTALFVPELDRVFLAVRARGSEPAAIWVYRPD